jgi:hypothetical protein
MQDGHTQNKDLEKRNGEKEKEKEKKNVCEISLRGSCCVSNHV